MNKNKILKFTIFLVLFLALAMLTYADDPSGCCCKDGQAYRGSFVRQSTCEAQPDYVFSTPTAQFLIGRTTSTVCTDWCGEQAAAPALVGIQCGSPSYNPGPENLQIKPVKGKRKLTLTWNNNCTDYIRSYEIKRYTGQSTQADSTISVTHSSFTDQSILKWGETYTYKIKTIFSESSSQEVTITGSPGDLECQNQGDNTFCISKYYYNSLKNYLQNHGYTSGSLTIDNNQFRGDKFDDKVEKTFNLRFNKAFRCDANNQLNQIQDCTTPPNRACIASGTTASCAQKIDCKEQASVKPFGLYSTKSNCEGTSTAKNYCFYDKSKSLVNDCINCKLGISCYDYMGKDACETDNCGAGNCEWHATFPLLGIGVCVDKRFDNCPLCDQISNVNPDAYNEVFDKCTAIKASALATQNNPCFYEAGEGKGCSNIGCEDYLTKSQCVGSPGSIRLDADNKIIQKSNDPCNIGVCEYDGQDCYKNANGKQDGPNYKDCALFSTERKRKECELDYFPPITQFIPQSQRIGIIDFFNIMILDKKKFTDDYTYISRAERANYPTYFCVYSGATKCYDYSLSTTSDQLVVDNMVLGEKTSRDVRILTTLTEGQNTIRYYTEDPNKNLEEVKEITFTACNGCQGPSLLDYEFLESTEIDNIHYIKNPRPTINLLFSTDTTLTTKEIIGMNQVIGTTAATTNNNFFIVTSASDLTEGTYKFKFDGVNTDSVPMESPAEINFKYDATPPTVRILVEDRLAAAEVYEKANIKLKLEFSEPILLEQVILAKPDIGEFAVLPDEENITDTLTTSDNTLYSTSLILPDGPNQIQIHAKDYAGNHLFDASTFIIFTSTPAIILSSPSFGVSSTPDFNLEVRTTGPADCKFWFNADDPVIPSPVSYDNLEDFTTTGVIIHSKDNLNRISSDKEKINYPLTVKCQSKYGDISRVFQVQFDTTEPEIISALVHPDPVIQKPFQTNLKVTTIPITFCKYDKTQKPFKQMQNNFPGYARVAQTSHTKIIEEQELGTYTYHISCITLAELGPATETVTFQVRDDVPFKIISNTQELTDSTEIILAIESNKDALCYYSTAQSSIGDLIGNENGSTNHVTTTTGIWGTNNYYVTCNTVGRAVINGTIETAKLTVTVNVGDIPANITGEGPCFNGILDTSEVDIDCGGACPNKCGENKRCFEENDCQEGLECIPNTNAEFNVCAGSELKRQIESLRDTDRDGLPDWWEEKYFGNTTGANPDDDPDKDGLTNLEEYNYYKETGNEIDPTNYDTDGDGWSDKKEIIKGYNPADINTHPPSLWWLWLIIILLILIFLGVTGYIAYVLILKKQEEEEKEEKRVQRKRKIIKHIQKQKIRIKKKIRKVKDIFVSKKKDYPTIKELKEEYKSRTKTKQQKTKETFTKLRSFLEGKPFEKPPAESIEQLRSLQIKQKEKPEPEFDSLIKLAVDRYPKEKRIALLKKLKLLKAGLLSPEEKQELLKELREVAKYWRTHKEDMKKEIERWMEKKPFKFVKKESKSVKTVHKRKKKVKKQKPKKTKKKKRKKKKKTKRPK